MRSDEDFRVDDELRHFRNLVCVIVSCLVISITIIIYNLNAYYDCNDCSN